MRRCLVSLFGGLLLTSHASSLLLPLVYDELRRLAAQKLAHEMLGQILYPTTLVHECYMLTCSPGASPPARPRGAGGRSGSCRPAIGQ
jgi:hypothetical protein